MKKKDNKVIPWYFVIKEGDKEDIVACGDSSRYEKQQAIVLMRDICKSTKGTNHEMKKYVRIATDEDLNKLL